MMLEDWRDHRVSIRRELESPIGSLNHTCTTCKVIEPGRSFLRMILDLLHRSSMGSVMCPHHHFCSDLQQWKSFIIEWNGVSFWKDGDQQFVEVTSDASSRVHPITTCTPRPPSPAQRATGQRHGLALFKLDMELHAENLSNIHVMCMHLFLSQKFC